MSALLDLVNTTDNTFKLYSSWKWHLLGPLKSECFIVRALSRCFISWWWIHTDFHFSYSVNWWMLKPSLVLDPVSKSPEASLEKVCIQFLSFKMCFIASCTFLWSVLELLDCVAHSVFWILMAFCEDLRWKSIYILSHHSNGIWQLFHSNPWGMARIHTGEFHHRTWWQVCTWGDLCWVFW